MESRERPSPDALLATLGRDEPERGRLKIFLGAAPGVGKTCEMLKDARARLDAGVDVVAGVVETHGRAGTEALAAGIPVLPMLRVPYRGRFLAEFDLEAAIARRPALLLLDELAHTNAPGLRHGKRWEDALALRDAGVPVWATLNVQHLESLNDDVARITGVRPSETLPDRVLASADEIELVDLPPAELRERLRAGKVYRPDNAARALDGFFREGNLAALREIALRRAAAHVDNDVQHLMRSSGVTGPWPTDDRILALIGADTAADAVVRQASRLAAALRSPWTVLHVERPGGDAVSMREPIALASRLGAELDLRASDETDLIAVVLAAARARNATHLVIGRVATPRWRVFPRRPIGAELARRGPEFVLHVVPAPTDRPVPQRAVRPPDRRWAPWAGTVAGMGALTAAGVLSRGLVPTEAADLVYLAAIVAIAAVWGTRPALGGAALALVLWDFFFVPPIHTVTIDSPRDLVTALVFATVAGLTGSLAGRVRADVRSAAARIEGLRRIGAFSRKLGEPATEEELLAEVAREASALANGGAVLSGDGDDLRLRAVAPPGLPLDEGARAAARWASLRGEASGQGTPTLPSASWRFLPLRTVRGRLGVLGVRLGSDDSGPLGQALEALADQASIALERVRLQADAARAGALEETQALRTALLASLGHDLRTPLTGIQGAAGTLRTAWDALSPDTRTDLLGAIEDDVGRMTRFLADITNLVRLESGGVSPALEKLSLADVVAAALGRVANALWVAVSIPDGTFVRADPILLEQSLVNVLDNARKYAPHGTTVRVGARPDGTDVLVSVADEGVGIPAADLPHVLDGFFRVRHADRTAPGLGLGLAIAKGFVAALGGAIAVTSPNPDAQRGGLPGTVVTIRLPRADAPPSLP